MRFSLLVCVLCLVGFALEPVWGQSVSKRMYHGKRKPNRAANSSRQQLPPAAPGINGRFGAAGSAHSGHHGHHRHGHHSGGHPLHHGHGSHLGYGYFGGNVYVGPGFHVTPFGYYPSYPGYPYYSGPVYPPAVMHPPVVPGTPYYGATVPQSPLIRESLKENERRWREPLDLDAMKNRKRSPEKTVNRFIVPSTPEAKLRSMRMQAKGDVNLRKQQYVQAYSRYKQAQSFAKDRAEPYFRMGYALVARRSYDEAVANFKQGLEQDPQWPVTGKSLEELFGAENQLATMSFLHKVAQWVREDVRDPDRLFLMGLLLHFNDDRGRAAPFFETALRLSGYREHLAAFLSQEKKGKPQAPQAPPGSGSTPATQTPAESDGALPPLPDPL